MKYLYLIAAILFEVSGTLSLKPNDVLHPLVQIAVVGVSYTLSFYFLYLTLDTLPVGIVYATWSGVGIVLISVFGMIVYHQKLDVAAWIGILLIIIGVAFLNLISKSSA